MSTITSQLDYAIASLEAAVSQAALDQHISHATWRVLCRMLQNVEDIKKQVIAEETGQPGVALTFFGDDDTLGSIGGEPSGTQ